MKDLTKIKVAIDAVIYKRRRYAPSYNAYLTGYRAPGVEAEYKQYVRLTETLDYLEDLAEIVAEPDPDPQIRLDL